MAAHVSAPVPPVSRQSGLPAKVDAVFERALAKRPADRYATCAEFVTALRAALYAGAGDTRVLAAPITAQTQARHRQPRWPLLAAGVGALVVVAVLLGVALSAGSGKPKAERRAQAPPKLPAAVHRTPPPVDPHVLNDRAWTLMQHGSYSAALPLCGAPCGLRGTGPPTPSRATRTTTSASRFCSSVAAPTRARTSTRPAGSNRTGTRSTARSPT
jgi:hypothetical protein